MKKQRIDEEIPKTINRIDLIMCLMKSVKVDVVANSIKYEKDDIDYFSFVDEGYDPLDGLSVVFR